MNNNTLEKMISNTVTQDNPIDLLRHFLDKEHQMEQARQIDAMRFVGYVLELGYDSAKIITSDPYKLAVGGIPRGSFLIMTPANLENTLHHFTLLRVKGVCPTPLSNQVQQTYFELHKKSMPELDVWTQSELQWGALDCDVLGMFYADPERTKDLTFSGDVNNVVSAHRYKVYSPDAKLTDLIINGIVNPNQQIEIGYLRTMECTLFSNKTKSKLPVKISIDDFKGCRTAMFGKTRLGKSNVVKLIAQGVLDATIKDNSVGQLIFDINGEYANDNPQDGNVSLRKAYEERCIVYAISKRELTPSRPLKLNFYEQPDSSLPIIASLLEQEGLGSNYIKNFASTELPSIEFIKNASPNDKIRLIRKIQIYWAVLYSAGFQAEEQRLRNLEGLYSKNISHFNPGFSKAIRQNLYPESAEIPSAPNDLDSLLNELKLAIECDRQTDGGLKSSSNKPLFDQEDLAMLNFIVPRQGDGSTILRRFLKYHDKNADDFVTEILDLLDIGKTVILDLGSANEKIREYFSNLLSQKIFSHQEEKFVGNNLHNKYIQLYFEEAHNLFPPDSKDLTGIYARFAKEGAKFHIGMVYSTQSPSTINKELLIQTENFFVGHLSSQDETRALSKLQIAFQGIEEDILRARTPGFMRMLTRSHRFIVPVQAYKFEVN